MEKGGDVESSGNSTGQLYPGMMESPELRWAFIRKVYTILALQFLLTVAVAAVGVFVRPIPHFFDKSGTAVIAVSVVIVILPFIMLCPLFVFRKYHPWNLVVLTLFSLTISILVGLTCAATQQGKAILEAATLTFVMVVSLTIYTFWAVRKGKDFSFLGPFLFASLLVLIVFGLIQIIFPLGKILHVIIGCLGAIIFCGFIVYDTDKLIKRHTYDEYIIAATELYLEIVNLFLYLLMGFDAYGD